MCFVFLKSISIYYNIQNRTDAFSSIYIGTSEIDQKYLQIFILEHPK
jgi:hypothetical protein